MRILSICLLALTLLTSHAKSQYIGPGSTPQGDYLRGLGVAEWGLGSYNLDTARADSINADTSMRLDYYIRQVTSLDREASARITRDRREKNKASYEARQHRQREHPELHDLKTGDALNKVYEQLNNLTIQESTFRSAPVALTVSQVRRIPFRLDEKGEIFSMQRLSPRGKGKWTIAFQDDRFALERRMFDRAVEEALEQMIEGKMTPEAIAEYESCVSALSNKLEALAIPRTERRYTEAKERIREMERMSRLLKTTKIQLVMADLDRYAGTTVNDLRLFMRKHNLRFSAAESADEMQLYPELYESLVQVREIVTDQGKGLDK